jgi:hypothetical protein
VAESTFSRVVGRFDALLIDERPEPFAVVIEFFAHPN